MPTWGSEKVHDVVQVEMHRCSIMIFPGGAYMCIPPVCTLVLQTS